MLKDNLLAEGWAFVPAEAAPEGLSAALACAELPHRYVISGKPFLKKIFKEDSENVPAAVLDLAKNPVIMDAVEAYLHGPVTVASLRLFHSMHIERRASRSQLYHCDGPEGQPMVKLFIYCTDVGVSNGPFCFLPVDLSDTLRAKTNYTALQRLSDGEVTDLLGPVTPITVTGPVGTMLLCDTARCFHYGARVSKGASDRLVAVVQYYPLT